MERTNKKKPQIQLMALETFSGSAFLSINKKLLSKYGPELTVYICNLIDKMQYFLQNKKLGADLSFFLLQKDQTIQTGMSEYQLRKCKKKLKKMNILHTEMRGIPPKEFYILNLEELVNKFLMNIPLVFKGIKVQKLKDSGLKNSTNIKETKYKENKYKENKNIKKDFLEIYLPKESMKNTSFQKIVKEFIQHRKEKHKPITDTAGKKLANKLSQYSIAQATTALLQSIENGWTGVFPEKKDTPKSTGKTGSRSFESGKPGKYAEAAKLRERNGI